MTVEEALATISARADETRAAEMAAYHKAPRRYLGVSVPEITELADHWREGATLEDRIALAAALWTTDIHEARIAAAKLLTQARIRPDDEPAWRLIASWVPDFDAWAIADHVASAGGRRLVSDPRRLDEVETWIESDHIWSRRAALVMTLPWTKNRFPKPDEIAVRERVLGWCAALVPDREWFIQKAIAWWLRDLSKRDPDRVRTWLKAHGSGMKGFARKEAALHLAV
ncbi:DNA alkylation repair protein [Rubellimicrobium rubrum]|uniref:DNA alkylation repair protein n=1 Tax=Rubellimicrobium rubrum TaxID=2585369 RepID=A0A5C4N026_9RHOB|nr:DNA alkylation repair protein [Rubellimicrobium rubrum]TNC50701.1 DNA alkylation repair protein [Rubellimicrobium rubrum]